MEIVPENLHVRVPLYIGSAKDVEHVINCLKQQ